MREMRSSGGETMLRMNCDCGKGVLFNRIHQFMSQ